jgi:hypothetical protein
MANPRGDKPPQLQAKINAIAQSSQTLVTRPRTSTRRVLKGEGAW